MIWGNVYAGDSNREQALPTNTIEWVNEFAFTCYNRIVKEQNYEKFAQNQQMQRFLI
jgi:hypothetical protein